MKNICKKCGKESQSGRYCGACRMQISFDMKQLMDTDRPLNNQNMDRGMHGKMRYFTY